MESVDKPCAASLSSLSIDYVIFLLGFRIFVVVSGMSLGLLDEFSLFLLKKLALNAAECWDTVRSFSYNVAGSGSVVLPRT